MHIDKIHTIPRRWSNVELRKVATLVKGRVVNVSGWRDEDKEGRHYREYFVNADEYVVTNFRPDMRGFQGRAGEIFLDLEKPLDQSLEGGFDCVFNHTTLEHVFDYQKALDNLCAMTRDLLILVVPFLQPVHSDYGDYWRFTPSAIAKLLEARGMSIGRLVYNNDRSASVYLFCVACKDVPNWADKLEFTWSERDESFAWLSEPYAGCNALGRRPKWQVKLSGLIRSISRYPRNGR